MSDFLWLLAIMTGLLLVGIGVIGGFVAAFMLGPMRKRIEFLESGFKARSNQKSIPLGAVDGNY